MTDISPLSVVMKNFQDGQLDDLAIKKIKDVLTVLSKEDALGILILAKDGLKSNLETPANIGLTKKQYYTRLKQLVDAGLLSKQENEYALSTFGKVVYENQIIGMANNIKISKDLQMIDVLKQSSKFNEDDIAKFLSKIDHSQLLGKHTSDELKNSVVISDFTELVSKILELIEFAKEEIILVSRFTSDIIINSLLKKASSGVIVKVLADVNMVENFYERAGDNVQLADKNKEERINVVANPYYPTKVERKYAKVPFCTLIVDKTNIGIEIVDNYNQKQFSLAYFVSDKKLSNQMILEFNKMWSKASMTPPQVITKAE